jgi:hypothetical protein
MTDTDELEYAILELVTARAPVSLEDLQQCFRYYSWNRLFETIDRLSRKGSLTIRRVDRCTYLLSPGPQPAPMDHSGRSDDSLAAVPS